MLKILQDIFKVLIFLMIIFRIHNKYTNPVELNMLNSEMPGV